MFKNSTHIALWDAGFLCNKELQGKHHYYTNGSRMIIQHVIKAKSYVVVMKNNKVQFFIEEPKDSYDIARLIYVLSNQPNDYIGQELFYDKLFDKFLMLANSTLKMIFGKK